jgi:ribose/xylose/arabinose/galactoside ABC-type transport system permease subunit
MYKAILGAFIVMIIENGLKIMGYASSEVSEFVQGLLLMVILFLTVFFELRRQKVKKTAGQEA